MTNPSFAGWWHSLLGVASVAAYSFSQHPDRLAFLFAAVCFVVTGAADRVIAHVKQSAK